MSAYKFKVSLILLLAVFICHKASAGTISVAAFSADSGVAHLETFRTKTVNVINGNISGAAGTGANINILAASVDEPDMYQAANPRVRDNELLLGNSGIDTFASGSLTQKSFVLSGGIVTVPGSGLVASTSAIIAYVGGYRLSISANNQTYANGDNYLDLSTTQAWTVSTVAASATPPAVAANSARIAKVVASAGNVTSTTDLANRRLPGLVVPANFRDGLYVSKDSSSTLTVFPGSCEINNTIVSKTAVTTLTLSTAGDWANSSSQRAADKFAFVGMDANGNIKMQTTAPTNDNYGVSTTAGKLRYATWNAIVYRILGWFYMDGNGSGNVEVASNIKEGNVPNIVASQDATTVLSTNTADATFAVARFYASGNPVVASIDGDFNGNGSADRITYSISNDGVFVTGTHRSNKQETASNDDQPFRTQGVTTPSQATHTYTFRAGQIGGSDINYNDRTMIIEEK